MRIEIPSFALVVLIGAAGAGKSHFAQRHFRATEVVSSDVCRAMVADDESAMEANLDAFTLLHTIAALRLRRGRLTVIDATNVLVESRRTLLQLARDGQCPAVAVALDLAERVCLERNALRADRRVPADVVRRHVREMHHSLHSLVTEGFDKVVTLSTVADVDVVTIVRTRDGGEPGGSPVLPAPR